MIPHAHLLSLTLSAIALGAAAASVYWLGRVQRLERALARARAHTLIEGERCFRDGMRLGHAAARVGRPLPQRARGA